MGFNKCKERRKMQRYSNILEKTFNVKITENPSQFLAICNGGLANGLSQEIILEMVQSEDLMEIVMPPGESVSFLQFNSGEACQMVYERHIGNSFTFSDNRSAFLAYVDSMPDKAEECRRFELPPGLIILDNFISTEEEKSLISSVAIEDNSSSLKHRAVKHFGFEFRYSDNRADTEKVDAVPEIPKEFSVLWDRLLEKEGIDFRPDQCTVNRYEPGQGIPPHVDTHSAFSEVIACLSLQSDIVMDWRQGDDQRQILVPRRSLSLFTGESRYGWTHAITPRKSDVVAAKGRLGLTLVPRQVRTSVTFRRTREGPCVDCQYPSLCDSHKNHTEETAVKEQQAHKFESVSVHQVYEEIAEHFSLTRHKPWANVVKFLDTFNSGDLILDVGCGNGKYFDVRKDIIVIGLDRSASLLGLCQNTYPTKSLVAQADCLQLPARDNTMDGAISIAVLHHLSTKERRLSGIQEIVRVLRPKGRVLIYVWAKNQEADDSKSSYLKQRGAKKIENETADACEVEGVCLPVHTNRTNFKSSDMLVPWKEKSSGTTFLRFYHVFEEPELREMCQEIASTKIVDYYYDQGNWCVILEKLDDENRLDIR